MKHRGSLIVGLLALCALIAILPLVTLQSEFGGAEPGIHPLGREHFGAAGR